jgi:predicted nucleic-acid-binding Zn-ribbon protein
MEKDTSCPKCAAAMFSQGLGSTGVGAARISNVEVYLCPKCGCKGWYNEKVSKIVELE